MDKLGRLIAFYLPQFHPIPENDKWWGNGFTEWTNVARAKAMFRGHYQPHIPADLGFYDLRVPETRIAQAEMAKEYGIDAFCYYHYWFAGKRLLERPFDEVLASGEPDYDFCLCWANHSWQGVWSMGGRGRTLIEQTYPGLDDHRAHLESLLPAFRDRRYVKVDGKPLLVIYEATKLPEAMEVTEFWRNIAIKAGLKGLYLVGVTNKPDWIPEQYGFDASLAKDNLPEGRGWVSRRRPIRRLIQFYQEKTGKPTVYPYKKFVFDVIQGNKLNIGSYPCIVPNWDNTPRAGDDGIVLHGSTPELFRSVVRKALEIVKDRPLERRLIFIKSWNEWAEGNYLEPDLEFGRGYLEVIKEEIFRSINH